MEGRACTIEKIVQPALPYFVSETMTRKEQVHCPLPAPLGIVHEGKCLDIMYYRDQYVLVMRNLVHINVGNKCGDSSLNLLINLIQLNKGC